MTDTDSARPYVPRDGSGRWLQSGNPAGRPKGSRNRKTLALDGLLEDSGERLAQKAIDLALEGDTTALKLCLERILPARRSRPISLDLPPIITLADVDDAMTVVLAALACGEIDGEQAQLLAGMLDAKRRSIESVDVERRLAVLEANEALPLVDAEDPQAASLTYNKLGSKR